VLVPEPGAPQGGKSVSEAELRGQKVFLLLLLFFFVHKEEKKGRLKPCNCQERSGLWTEWI
jgi:hypothetical protein